MPWRQRTLSGKSGGKTIQEFTKEQIQENMELVHFDE